MLTVVGGAYSYNTRQKDISVVEIAFRRSLAVTVGVVWAFLVSRFWWPSEGTHGIINEPEGDEVILAGAHVPCYQHSTKGAQQSLGRVGISSLISCDRLLNMRLRFCLNIGWLYTRLVASNSFSAEAAQEVQPHPTEESSLIPRQQRTALSNSIEEFMSMWVSPP